MYDIVIVGGGPTGNYVSGKLSEAGFKTMLFEEHEEIGIPVHCTGIIGSEVFRRFNLPRNSILSELSFFKIFAPDNLFFTFPRNIKPFIVDRAKFDDDLAKISIKKGTIYELKAKVEQIEHLDKKIKVKVVQNKQEFAVEAKLCIIATGSMSNLPYECGISRPRFFYKSVQTELEVIDLEGAEIYVGEKIAPGSFGYAVATNKKLAKVGVITHLKAKSCFENLINSKFLHERLRSSLELVKYRRIPMGMPKSSQNGRIIALGDAAAQLKTTTGGGVYTGLVCSDILVKNIKEAYNGKDFSLKKIGNYDKAWKKAIGLELQAGLLVRSFFEKVEDKYLNKLFGLMTVPSISEIISQKGDFDRHRDLIIALMKIPEVRKLVLEIIKRNLPQKRFFTSIVNYVDSLI